MAAPYGYQAITPVAATKLTVPNGAFSAVVSVETNSVRWTVDGTTPTSTVGNLIAAGSQLEFVGPEIIGALQIIDSSGASSVKVAYAPKVQ